MEDCAIRQLDRGQQKPCFANVYPRDAMLAWYNYAIVLCLSVCVSVTGRSGWTAQADVWHRRHSYIVL